MNINEFLIKLFGSAGNSAEYEQIEQWKEEGLANAKSLQDMLNVNKETDILDGYKSFDVEHALMKNMEMMDQESPVEKTTVKKTYGKSILLVLAALLAITAGAFMVKNHSGSTDFQYAGEVGKTLLENGTHITLNENSTYRFDKSSNVLELKGEAHFDVAKQQTPFVVTTEHGSITVVGTEFNVRTSIEGTEVYMHEGAVTFDNKTEVVSLTAGDLLYAAETLQVVENQETQLFSYWHTHKLDYKNVALTNVLNDINRLYGKSLSAGDVNTDDVFITSSFEGNSLEEIVMIIEKIANVSLK